MRTIQSESKRLGFKTQKPIKRDKKKEALSEKDIKELMGTNRPTYKRHIGGVSPKVKKGVNHVEETFT